MARVDTDERRPQRRRWRRKSAAASTTVAMSVVALLYWSPLYERPEIEGRVDVPPRSTPAALRVLSLNAAHGRGTAFHQALTRRNHIHKNLDAIAEVILATDADVVALQELDGPSSWSGSFDHLEYLAEATGFAHSYHGHHVELRRPRLVYGTGVLSRYPIRLGESHAFGQNALDTKGFVYTHIDAPGVDLALVSVHLDFKRDSERRAQLALMSERLEGELAHPDRALVVAGDFNTVYDGRRGTLRRFADRHVLGWEGRLPTFPSRRPRRPLDYVLSADDLEVSFRRAIDVQVSDHLPVLVEVTPR